MALQACLSEYAALADAYDALYSTVDAPETPYASKYAARDLLVRVAPGWNRVGKARHLRAAALLAKL